MGIPIKKQNEHIKTRRIQKQISVDGKLATAIDKHPEINWSSVAREAFQSQLQKLGEPEGAQTDRACAGFILVTITSGWPDQTIWLNTQRILSVHGTAEADGGTKITIIEGDENRSYIVSGSPADIMHLIQESKRSF